MSTGPHMGAKRLRELLADKSKIIACPGVYDGLTARIALSMGFDALYMTGSGTSMSRLGWADLGMATLTDMTANAEMIANLDTSVPLIADADTGYGGPVMVSRTLANYARAGVAALHIEDQVQEKRCGFLGGKNIVSREVWYSRLRAAINAREKMKSDIVIIGRTDSLQKLGFEEALERLKGAVEIGVDVAFMDAIETREQCKALCEAMGDTPVLFDMVPGAGSPDLTVDEAKELGFRIIIFPGVCSQKVLDGVKQTLSLLKTKGVEERYGTGGVNELFMTCGLGDCIEIDKQAGGGKALLNICDEPGMVRGWWGVAGILSSQRPPYLPYEQDGTEKTLDADRAFLRLQSAHLVPEHRILQCDHVIPHTSANAKAPADEVLRHVPSSKECLFTRTWERPVRLRKLQSRASMPALGIGSQGPSEAASSVSPAATQSSHDVSNSPGDVSSMVKIAVVSQSMARNSLHQFFEHGMGAEDWEVFDRSNVMRLAYVGTTVSNLSHLMNLDPQRKPSGPTASLHLPHPHTHPILSWKPEYEQTLFNIQLQGAGADPYRDLSSFPVRHIRDSLVDAFFDKINPYFPVIDEFDFRRQYADPSNPPPLILMHSVLLAGAHVCKHPRVAQSRAVVTATLFSRAKALFDMRHENNRVHLIQCALLFTWHLENSDSAGANSYYWAGVACRIAFGIGMHRNLSPQMRACMMPLAERRMYRRLWWTLFQTEICTALEHGRPSMIQLDDVDQPPLEPDDFREENGAVNEKLNFHYCSGNVELCYIVLEILRLNKPHATSSYADAQATLASLDARLVDWILAHPASDDFASLQLHLHYNTILLHLHRNFISADTAGGGPAAAATLQQQCTSTEICGRAASAIIATFETMLSNDFIAQTPFTATIALTAAAIHISLEIRLAIEAGSTLLALNTQSSLERLFEPCKELSQYWPNAEGVLNLFRSLLEKFKSKVVSNIKNSVRKDTSTSNGGDAREHTVPPAGPGNHESQEMQEGEVGEAGPYVNFHPAPDLGAGVHPLIDALDWQDIFSTMPYINCNGNADGNPGMVWRM